MHMPTSLSLSYKLSSTSMMYVHEILVASTLLTVQRKYTHHEK